MNEKKAKNDRLQSSRTTLLKLRFSHYPDPLPIVDIVKVNPSNHWYVPHGRILDLFFRGRFSRISTSSLEFNRKSFHPQTVLLQSCGKVKSDVQRLVKTSLYDVHISELFEKIQNLENKICHFVSVDHGSGIKREDGGRSVCNRRAGSHHSLWRCPEDDLEIEK